MTKKDFIALADMIREHNESKRRVWGANAERMCFNVEQINALADFCRSQNSNFMREALAILYRWRVRQEWRQDQDCRLVSPPGPVSSSEENGQMVSARAPRRVPTNLSGE